MNKNIVKRIVQTFLTLILQAVLLFVAAWTVKWIWAWIFVLMGILILIINAIVLPAEVIEERGRKKKNVKKWDKLLTTLNIVPLLGIYVISGLDYRYQITGDFSVLCHSLGLAFVFLGSMLFTWSMVSNKFFSTMVRIQSERGHQVATRGPYKFVRHPGYVGFIIMSVATPIALGSLYALPMAFLVCALFVVRTHLEDQTLAKELPGFIEYSQQVKYRLIPFIW